jgi:salicylate hydroxylase
MSLKHRNITVLGAGIGGLAAACILARRGAKVTVLEQADAIREVGAGLQVSPNGAAVLRAMGLAEVLAERSVRAEAVQLCDGYSGSGVLRLDLARLRPEQGYHFLHRADLIDILLTAARDAGVELQLLQKIKSVDLSGPHPVLQTQQGATREADLLIGADGLHSVLRQALNGTMAPFFTHQVAWRALVPASGDEPAVAEVHMGRGRHLVSYPLRGGQMRNIVAVEERRRWAEESWSLRDDALELRLAFEGFGPRVQGWLDQVQDVWLWGLFRHPVARRWHGPGAAILGDAAHPTLPFLAQGANMALEDAWVLGAELDRGAPDDQALGAYQAARAARCARIVAAANSNAKAYHLNSPLREMAHLALRLGGKLAPAMPLRRFDWLYGADVTEGQRLS